MTIPRGGFSWFELATRDQAGAKAFYCALFGWTFDDSPTGPPDQPNNLYTQFSYAGSLVGAAYTMEATQQKMGVPSNWLPYVQVDSADATAEAVTVAGGTTVMPPFDVGAFGRMAVVQDPTGAMVAAWQAYTHHGVGSFGTPFSAGWVELSSPDPDRATAFYREVFGWQTLAGKNEREPSADDYLHIVNGGDMIGGVVPASMREPNQPASWLVYFSVPDCAATVATAVSLGATIVADTMNIGENGTVAVLTDPQGAFFALHQPPQMS